MAVDSAEYAVVAKGVSKAYRLYGRPLNRLKEALTGRVYHKKFWALRDVSFSVKRGSTMGILGVNGSGKSTLLKIICGYLPATKGEVETRGRVASILELGTGFNRDFTGRQNVILYGGLIGLSKRELDSWIPRVQEFADIGPFFERPLRMYSSGMYARLAFACAINTNPDVLIIDEALSVGDIAFQHKCINRLREIQKKGVSILFVSHSMGAVKSLCQEAILLDSGRVIQKGDAEDVANYYHAMLAEKEARQSGIKTVSFQNSGLAKKSDKIDSSSLCVGSGEVRIDEVCLEDEQGKRIQVVEFDQEVAIKIRLLAVRACRPEVAGIIIRDRYGIDLLGTNTAIEGVELPELDAGQGCQVKFRLKLPLQKGSYSVTAAVGYDPERPIFYDWRDNACVFEVLPPHRRLAACKFHVPFDIEIQKMEQKV